MTGEFHADRFYNGTARPSYLCTLQTQNYNTYAFLGCQDANIGGCAFPFVLGTKVSKNHLVHFS